MQRERPSQLPVELVLKARECMAAWANHIAACSPNKSTSEPTQTLRYRYTILKALVKCGAQAWANPTCPPVRLRHNTDKKSSLTTQTTSDFIAMYICRTATHGTKSDLHQSQQSRTMGWALAVGLRQNRSLSPFPCLNISASANVVVLLSRCNKLGHFTKFDRNIHHKLRQLRQKGERGYS